MRHPAWVEGKTMEFFEAVHRRCSIRKFQAQPVEAEKLTRILEAARRAPSAGNLQAYRIFVVKGTSLRGLLARAACDQEFVREAPLVLIFCADPRRSAVKYGSRGERLYAIQDATIACAYAQLAAAAVGISSVWVGAFEPETVRKVLGIAESLWPLALLPLGYPAEPPAPSPRRPLAQLVKVLA